MNTVFRFLVDSALVSTRRLLLFLKPHVKMIVLSEIVYQRFNWKAFSHYCISKIKFEFWTVFNNTRLFEHLCLRKIKLDCESDFLFHWLSPETCQFQSILFISIIEWNHWDNLPWNFIAKLFISLQFAISFFVLWIVANKGDFIVNVFICFLILF